MNFPIIRYILGWVLIVEGLLMLIPLIVGFIYSESSGLWFLYVSLLSLVLGAIMSRKKPTSRDFFLREGCVTTALSWIVMSVIGCLPFCLSGEIPSFADAMFEIISGFTTTGASVLSDVESLSHSMLFWRSFSHWIGGMGVLVFLLAVIQMAGGSGMNLMRAESPGPTVGKLRPKLRQTARILYLIYLSMTVMEIILLLAGGMSLFDSLTTSFGTAGTGGFGVKNDSMMSYSPYIQWVVAIFMALFGVNFSFYYLLLMHRWKQALKMEEVRGYFVIILAAIAIIIINIGPSSAPFGELLRHSAFQVSSIITTTGFATADFNLWPETSRFTLVLLMFIGSCAGSTGGGIKVSRVIMMVKTALRELQSYVFPKSIKLIKMDGKPVEREVLHGTYVFFIAYMLIYVVSVFIVSFDGFDSVSNLTAVAATFNNIGPGLELAGPTGNFGAFSDLSKYVMMFDMLAGRLELFPMLLLFYPKCWSGMVRYRKRVK